MESNNKHLHFIVWAYEKIEPGTGNYLENTVIDLIDTSTNNAIKRAKGLVSGKAGYCIRSVIEHYDGLCHVKT